MSKGFYTASALTLLLAFFCANQTVASTFEWTTMPTYESSSPVDLSSLHIKDGNNDRIMYDESFAVLIAEEHYTKGWSSPVEPGERSIALLKKALEARGFHVLIWKDLKADQLNNLLNDVLSNFGYLGGARLFFYYFGHGTHLGTKDDDAGVRTYLVPIDAPDPEIDLAGFHRKSFPVSRLTSVANEMTLKHAFFALEACNAGGIISSLSRPPPPNPLGYIFGNTVRKQVRQFLTAGDADQEVPAGALAALIVAALDEKSRNSDGYVTGNDVISYVSRIAPQFMEDYPLNPAYGSLPHAGGGDIIMGKVDQEDSLSGTQKPPTDRNASVTTYRACRLPENGIDAWEHEGSWSKNSGWLGGGNNQTDVCNGLIAAWQAANTGHVVSLLKTGEQSKKDFLGHVEYMYFCSGTEKSLPVYKSAENPACGINKDENLGKSTICQFDSGWVDYAPLAPVPVGLRCTNGSGGYGIVVEFANKVGSNLSEVANSMTLKCRFTQGARAGTTVDFGGTAGARPAQVGSPCSDGQNSFGVAVR